MELFDFIQRISFSPLRSLLQDTVLDLCDQRLPFSEVYRELLLRFPELAEPIQFILKGKIGRGGTLSSNQEGSLGITRIIYGEAAFPQQLRLLRDPPWTLTLVGSQDVLKKKTLSIVGSREPNEESIDWLNRELGTWPQRGWVFASGGARGIDQIAHRICLRQQQPTIVFLPSGIQQIYPHSLQGWKDQIIFSGGCLVSEFPDDFSMRKYAFSFRNRLIAALGAGLLVVEAGEKSGSVMTGRIALEMGRPVFVIPGHPCQDRFRGSLELMRLGAQWIENAQDLNLFLSAENEFRGHSDLPIGQP